MRGIFVFSLVGLVFGLLLCGDAGPTGVSAQQAPAAQGANPAAASDTNQTDPSTGHQNPHTNPTDEPDPTSTTTHAAHSTTTKAPSAGPTGHGGSKPSGGHEEPGQPTDHQNMDNNDDPTKMPADQQQAPTVGHGDPSGSHEHSSGGHGDPSGGHGDPSKSHKHPNGGHGDPSGGHGAPHGDDGNHTGNHSGGHHGHEIERFHVMTMDFNRVSLPFVICCWIVFATLAKILFHLNHTIPSIFPESCLLITLGIVIGLIVYFTNKDASYELQSDTFFFYLLPPIILEAGYFMPIRSFFDNIGTILCFAVVGTLINTFLIGFSLYAFNENGLGAIDVNLDVLHCLVFGALISAVDPVAVLAVFDEVAVNEVLHICVFGESLLNDAVTVVLYHMMEGFSHIGMKNIVGQDIAAGVGSFFIVGVGGTLVGIIFGFVASLMTRFTKNAPVVEPLIVFTLGYMSYIAAEIFHLSGIMACVFCGVTMKKYIEVNITRKSHTTIKYFMKMLASLCETIIFMFLGMSTVNDHHEWNTGFILFSVIFCIVYRALAVIVQCLVLNNFRANKLNKVDQFIMAYGGLRGAIAFSLAVLLNPEVFPEKDMLITATLVVVYFTVFVQGTTIKPLVKVLRVKRASKHKPNMNEKLHDRMIDHMMAGIEDITGHFGHHEMRARFQKIDNLYVKPIVLRKGARKYRGASILQVFRKLNEKDAEEYLKKQGSFVTGGIEDTMKSFGNLFSVMSRVQSHSNSSSTTSLPSL